MALADDIRAKVAAGQFEFSRHAMDQAVLRRVGVQEIREAVASGEVIEDYRNDKYGPSCLLFGLTAGGRPLHVQCSHPSRPLVKVVTVYEPDPKQWTDCRIRR